MRDLRGYTPKHIAEKILSSRAALEGERKHVTVLFADVKGSMDLAEQVDPEAWHGIMDRFFQLLAEGVHRFEGTVNQYTFTHRRGRRPPDLGDLVRARGGGAAAAQSLLAPGRR